MRKFLLSLAAATALAASGAPALAQSWHDGGYRSGQLTTGYVDGLEWKINNAARQGWISWGEARGLTRELRDIQPLAWRVQTGQASRWEARRLQQGVDRIESAVDQPRWADRYDRYDRRWRR